MNHLHALPVLSNPDASLTGTLRVLRSRELVSRRQALRRIGAGSLLAISPLKALACAVIPSETAIFSRERNQRAERAQPVGHVRSDIRASGPAGTTVAAGTPVRSRCNWPASYRAPLADMRSMLALRRGGPVLDVRGAPSRRITCAASVTDAKDSQNHHDLSRLPGPLAAHALRAHSTVAQTVSGSNAIKTRIALPESTSRQVYTQDALYPSSAASLKQMSLASDGVFGDDGGVGFGDGRWKRLEGRALSLPVALQR
jgi:hypothetical protein